MSRHDTKSALSRWPLEVATCELAAERENVVYRVTDSKGSVFALRFHRPSYRNEIEIESELKWMAHLQSNGIAVPKPLASKSGGYIETIDGGLVSVLSWLDGRPLGKAGQALVLDDRLGTFFQFGAALANLHRISDTWTIPKGFSRPAWDHDGLTGDAPYWGPYWENPTLDADEKKLIIAARDKARDRLQRNSARLDFGLIHADVVRENVLVDDKDIKLIDFDDGGTGYRLFDIATALLKNRAEPDYAALEKSFLDGYHSVRQIDLELFPDFLILRAFTYLGWIIPRLSEKGMEQRNQWNVKAALALTVHYLK